MTSPYAIPPLTFSGTSSGEQKWLATMEVAAAKSKAQQEERKNTRTFGTPGALSPNMRSMINRIDYARRLLRSPSERIQFFAFLKELFNANCDKSKSSDQERARLSKIADAYETVYPSLKILFDNVRGKGWETQDCAVGLRYFPAEPVLQTVPTPTTTSTPAPTFASDGVDGWW